MRRKKYVYVINSEEWYDSNAEMYTTLHLCRNYKVDHRIDYVVIIISGKKYDKIFENALMLRNMYYEKIVVK